MVIVKESNTSSIPSHTESSYKRYSDTSVGKLPQNFQKNREQFIKSCIANPKDGEFKIVDNLVRLPAYNINDTDLSFTEVLSLLQKAMFAVEELERSVSNYNVSDSTVDDYRQKLKEAEIRLMKVQKQFSYFKLYSFIWIFSFILFSFFALMFVAGIISPFIAGTGLIATFVGGVGAYLDWKDKEKGL